MRLEFAGAGLVSVQRVFGALGGALGGCGAGSVQRYKLMGTHFSFGHHAYPAHEAAGRGPSDTAGASLRAKHAYVLKCANADACFVCTWHIGPASLQYGNTRASRAKVDKGCTTKPRFV